MVENCPVTPLSQSEIINNPQIVNLNYTNQEFWSLKSRLIDYINSRFGPNGSDYPNVFNDLVEGSIAIMLIETWAFIADTLSFKIDQIANEIFIDTVTEKDNIFRLAKLVGFQPTPPISAKSFWIVSLGGVLSNDAFMATPVTINVVTDDGTPIVIELFPSDADGNPIMDDDIVIPAGSVSNSSIVGLEGQTFVDNLAGTGEIGQTILIQRGPVIFDSVIVSVDGSAWDRVDYFSDSQPRREFRVEFDSDYNAYVIFGNSRAGLIPSRGATIAVTYRIGGGTRGNIITGFVETQKQAPVPGLSVTVPITIRNYTKGQNGYNGDTIEDVRRKLPIFLRTQDRAVSDADYQTLAEQFVTPYQGQIGRATAVLRNSGCAGNIIDLYILARDGDDLVEASSQLKAALITELNAKKMLTDHVCIKNGVVIPVEVTIEAITSRSQRKFETELNENVVKRVNNFFLLENWSFNKDLKVQDIIKELSDLKQIQSFEITLTTSDPDNSGVVVIADFNEIIRPDTINISFLFE